MRGRFLKVVKNKELIYTWNWESSKEKTIITVQFDDNGDQTTSIHLTHEGFLTKESAEMHKKGWDYYIDELEKNNK